MNREEALKKWKEEVDKWKVYGDLNFSDKSYVSHKSMKLFIEILDALIAPEETCTEKAEKSTDDLAEINQYRIFSCLHDVKWATQKECTMRSKFLERMNNLDDGWKPWPPHKSLQYDPLSFANIEMKTDSEGAIKWWRNAKAD